MIISNAALVSERTDFTQLNELDRKILVSVYQIRETNLSKISKRIGVSKSAVHHSLKKLKNSGFLKGIIPLINVSEIDSVFTAISLIYAKHTSEDKKALGAKIAKIKGIWAVYYVIGRVDFVVLTRAKNKNELREVISELSRTPGIKSSSTIMALSVEKEDFPESMELLISD